MAGLFKKTSKKLLKSPIFLKILGFIIFCYARLAYLTCKWEFRNVDKIYKIWDENKSIILVCWHGRVTLVPFLKKKSYKIDALVSLHQDGMLMANYLKHCDIGIIGGSSHRNSRAAAVKLMNNVKKDQSICIIPDGPQGPNMKMTESPIYFAKKSAKPIIAVVYSMKKAKIIRKAWDQMLIPPLFSQGIFDVLGPYFIPEEATDQEMEEQQQKIQNDMNESLFNLDKECGIPKVELGKISKKKLKKEKKEK